MDRSVYVAMTGATQIMRAQAEVAHNLANANTTGFKAELSAFQSVPVQGDGLQTRINGVAQGTGWDTTQGTQTQTGNDLDVSVQGNGWIAVQTANGTEGYTRAGNLRIDDQGLLTDARGNAVLGGGGPITIPQASSVKIGSDGTISIVPLGESPATVATTDRIKLVNPGNDQISLGSDGLMHMKDGSQAQADADVKVVSGAIEASNVNPSDVLVKMISLSREFEMQVRSIKTADENAQSASKLLQVG
ncbi:flagellar basal-body rod protein FlgF [Luteibacter sp. UNC138MFCol5.1]|uniref:flagellar basal-body rod protein FlgF n=1 Tax=Luteibacter sp. UNC138MFCol5.1 TaxID=1502774 RepID=UPI0008C839B2|nr:flagellar basal-body rod protein FlgF [Luteibacter sp. UNC138MFCol5.1]SEO66966.1 flagellar basal-body rod protein FlgF [Luteibacter sp. UNC138MFCol5.1]